MCAVLYDVYKIREDFPILRRKVNGHSLVYLDNAATTQKPIQVIEKIKEFYSRYNANIHRGLHRLSQEASDLYDSARVEVARFINASEDEVIFVKNATEGVNLFAYGYGLWNLDKKDIVLNTLMDHHATIVPFYIISRRIGFKQLFIDITDDGYIDMESYEKLLSLNPKIVTFPHVSNMLGIINDVKKLTRLAHRHGAITILDATQSAPHMRLDVRDLDVDVMVFSAHKMCGPTGVGVVYIKKDILNHMYPFMGGGDMIKSVSYDDTFSPVVEFNKPPVKYEAGTPNIAGVAVFPESIKYLLDIGFHNIHSHIKRLVREAYDKLSEVDGIEIYGPRNLEDRAGIITFNVRGFSAHEVASYLDSYGIAVRSGHHCTGPLHKRLGISSSARISFYIYNTLEEVEYVLDKLRLLT